MKGIVFERPKGKTYLTLSVKLKDSLNIETKNQETFERIKKYQNRIQKEIKKEIKNIRSKKSFKIAYTVEELKSALKDRNKRKIIYKYPEEQLHFSLVNFLTYDVENNEEIYKEIKKIKTGIKNVTNSLNQETEANIERIYVPEVGVIKDSIALNIYPKNQNFFKELKKIEGKTKQKLLELKLQDNNVEVKCHKDKETEYKYFAINIFRFLSKEDGFVMYSSLYEEIEEINKELKKERLSFKFKPSGTFVSGHYFFKKLASIDI